MTTPPAINLIHFASQQKHRLVDELYEVRRDGGHYLLGVQLNMAWPEPRVFANLRERFVRNHNVLHLGGHALKQVNWEPGWLCSRVAQYEHCVDGVLIDPSGGKGEVFNPSKVVDLVHVIKDRSPHLQIGVAGGLCAETVENLRPIVQICPYVSIDAEGRLRDDNDHLDLNKVRSYFRQALPVLRGN